MPSSFVEIVSGDLLKAGEKYLCHQTNCITNKAAHLSQDVFKRFPWADVYTNRQSPDEPGTIAVRGDGQNQRYVINLFGQYYPGKPRYPNSQKDGTEARKKYFHQCLNQISKIIDLESLAFPSRIGCGAAGGNWTEYLDLINRFADYVNKAQKVKIIIYQLDS